MSVCGGCGAQLRFNGDDFVCPNEGWTLDHDRVHESPPGSGSSRSADGLPLAMLSRADSETVRLREAQNPAPPRRKFLGLF